MSCASSRIVWPLGGTKPLLREPTLPWPVAVVFPCACRGEFGPDVSFINSALQHVFDRFTIDPLRCGLAGKAFDKR